MTVLAAGDTVTVEVRAIVHGGHALAAILGDESRRTVFVRHAAPGEVGRALITRVQKSGKIIFADLVEVLQLSQHRVTPPCPVSGPGRCGGCDFQHLNVDYQRHIKAEVVADALRRIGGFDPDHLPWDHRVRAVPGDQEGLRWRSRSRFAVQDGSLIMRAQHSHEPIPVTDCLIAQQPVVEAATAAAPGQTAVVAVNPSAGPTLAGPVEKLAGETVQEAVGGVDFTVAADGFWQVHPGAPAALVDAVTEALAPEAGSALADLYGGVGLFAKSLGVKYTFQRIDLVEGDRKACTLARENLAELPAFVHHKTVADWLDGGQHDLDLVVLDPPRAGAGAKVMQRLARRRTQRIAYVACDPAAMARDLKVAITLGYRLESLQAFDLFPMTAHVECVAGLIRSASAIR